MSIDRNTLRTLRTEIDKALAVVALKNGLTRLAAGSCTFDPSSGNFTFKVEGVASGGTDRAGALYNSIREFDKELPPLGHAFIYQDTRYEIIGANTTGTKVRLRRGDGKTFQFKTDLLKAFIAKKGGRS